MDTPTSGMRHSTSTLPGDAARAGSNASAPRAARVLTAFFCLLFFLEGLVFIPYVGLQNDEMLFTGAIYPPWRVEHALRIAGHTLPTMLNSYLGTLKACVYRLSVFVVWPPSPWSVRIPALLIGIAALWLFFELVLRVAGDRAALVATALLATDATWVLTTCLDWGPVALQHLFLLSGVLALWAFHRSGNLLYLGAGFLAFGLGLWDKALFTWALSGLAVASAVVFPRALFSRFTARNLAVAAAGLLIGAAPLILYNQASRFETFRANTHLSTDRFGHKLLVLRNSIEGAALFDYLVRAEPVLDLNKPANALERLSLDLSEASGHRTQGLLSIACVLAFALLPWLWTTPARRTMLFAAIFVAVTWVQMAVTSKAGGGVHHTALLWPFPHLFVAAALARASQALHRTGLLALVLVTAAVCGSNLTVLNEYLARLIERGPTAVWTDAVYPLAAYVRGAGPTRVYITDWGVYDALRALNEGRSPLVQMTDGSQALASSDALFIGHTEGNQIRPETAAALDQFAQSQGLRKHVLKVITDRNRRPIFEVYRFTRP